jgi:RNA polymerase sigma factor for flagellar operon FliA
MALRYLVDELRKVDPMPRRARLRMRETQRARNELAQTLGHVPTEPEVARRLGVEVREHRALLDRFAPAQVGSLEAWADGVRAGARSASCRPDPGSVAEAAEDRARLV